MDRYEIWEGHMEALKKKIKRIEKKCRKYGCDFHFEEVGEVYKEVAKPNYYDPYATSSCMNPETVTCRYIIVEVEGNAVINDWELIAYTEHTEKGNIYSKIKEEVEIPTRYRATDCFCEHCKTRRARKNTCIVRNIKTDEFKQVGNNCLMDFTRGMDASIVSAIASGKDIFEEAQSAPIGEIGWRERYLDTKTMLRYTAETIKHFGYANSSCFRSTRSRMMNYYEVSECPIHPSRKEWAKGIRKEMEEVGFDPNSEYAVKKSEEALAWIEEQEASNDYMHNLKTVCSLRYVGWANLGILVSLFPTFDRGLEIEAERKAREEQRIRELEEGKNSEYVGEVGKRIRIKVASCRVITSWASCYDGWHQTLTYMYRITDENGNIYIWKTSKKIDEEAVDEIVGTVKEHSEFREVKQTVLTRCKVEYKKAVDILESLDI